MRCLLWGTSDAKAWSSSTLSATTPPLVIPPLTPHSYSSPPYISPPPPILLLNLPSPPLTGGTILPRQIPLSSDPNNSKGSSQRSSLCESLTWPTSQQIEPIFWRKILLIRNNCYMRININNWQPHNYPKFSFSFKIKTDDNRKYVISKNCHHTY